MNFSRPASPHILIASENPLEAQAFESMLRAAHYDHVRATTDLRQVSALFIKWRFRLLIIDMQAARIDGIEVIKGLAEPVRTGEMCVLALLDPGDEVTHLGAMAAGAVGVLTRPPSMAQALPQIEQVLSTLYVED